MPFPISRIFFVTKLHGAVVGTLLLLAAPAAHGADPKWAVPTAAELSMTSDPKSPGAAAVVLSYDRYDDGETGDVSIHARIKVFTEAGRNVGDFGQLEGQFSARTIHPDGTVVPLVIPTSKNLFALFIGKTSPAIATALVDVTVGSIVEYVYHTPPRGYINADGQFLRYYSPDWVLQRAYFTHAAHFELKTPSGFRPEDTRWIANLPRGAEVKQAKGRIDLDLVDVPAAPAEDFMPPATTAIYNVHFFYYSRPRDIFWGVEGASRKKFWDELCAPNKAITAIVQTIIQPTDADALKLRKLYAAVQALENIDLIRERTAREEKGTGFVYAKNAAEIWTRQRGNSIQLTLLFVALARAAGYDAAPMAVASRDSTVFNVEVLSWDQLDSMIAIVIVNGKEIFFDPGTRRCPFGHIAPWHANVTGVTVHGTRMLFQATPSEAAKESRTDRVAELNIDPSGLVSGAVRPSFNGTSGIPMRLAALLQDEQFVRSAIEKSLQSVVPTGVDVKLQSLDGLTDPEVPLVAKFTVTGHLGVSTAKRLLLPAQFFASTEKPLFSSATRATPIAFPGRYATRDQLTLRLPAGLTVENLPQAQSITTSGSTYDTRIQPPSEGHSYILMQRLFSLERADYPVDDYQGLHKYFSQIAGVDQEQLVLQSTVSTK